MRETGSSQFGGGGYLLSRKRHARSSCIFVTVQYEKNTFMVCLYYDKNCLKLVSFRKPSHLIKTEISYDSLSSCLIVFVYWSHPCLLANFILAKVLVTAMCHRLLVSLPLATLGGTAQIGLFQFVSHHPRGSR
jgi:hypothetical protein